MTETDTIWFNGELRDQADCKVHVLSHALHYGSSVFEGIRAYETPEGTAVFRLSDHIRRLRYSSDVYRIPLVYSDEVLRSKIKAGFPKAISWPVGGLPDGYLPLLAPGRDAFVRQGEHVVCHGGISIEEMIVPLVQIHREGA